jgi:hypothetical protein
MFQGLLLAVIVIGLGYLLFGTGLFLVGSIEFLDEQNVDEATLLQSSEMALGEHILLLDTKKAVENLEGLGYVKNANIVRVFPDKVKVYITPRQPILMIRLASGYANADGEGVVAEVSETPTRWDLTLVTGLETAVILADTTKPFETDPSWIGKEVLAAMLYLKDEGLGDRVTEIHVTDDRQLHLYTKGGSVIKTTDKENIASKIDFLFTYLTEKDDRMIIDLTHGGNPTFTPR